jgi:hypothetical protein
VRQLLALFLLALALPCAAVEYHPSIYPLRAGLVVPLHVAGNVSIVNAQPKSTDEIVYKYSFAKMTGTMHDVTQTMADQTRMELGLKEQAAAPADKTIELKVNSLLSKYKFFSWASNMQFEARLGDGTVITKDVPHASGVLIQDLNGCIAEGVIALLADPQVRAYIEAPAAGATGAAPAAAAEAPAAAAAEPSTQN